jgi:hypothetical protein
MTRINTANVAAGRDTRSSALPHRYHLPSCLLCIVAFLGGLAEATLQNLARPPLGARPGFFDIDCRSGRRRSHSKSQSQVTVSRIRPLLRFCQKRKVSPQAAVNVTGKHSRQLLIDSAACEDEPDAGSCIAGDQREYFLASASSVLSRISCSLQPQMSAAQCTRRFLRAGQSAR